MDRLKNIKLTKIQSIVIIGLIGLLSMVGTYRLLEAGSISGSLYSMNLTVLNNSGGDLTNTIDHFSLSTQSLIDNGFLDTDTLNATIHEGATDVVFMPGTTKIDILAAFNSSGGNETTQALNSTINDVTLPATGSSVFEIALHNPGEIVHVNIGTAADVSWTIAWEYYNGASWTSFSNISDGTQGFTESGNRIVSWDMPSLALWPRVNYHSIDGFWLRARVASYSIITTSPLGTQVWYETGVWWTYTGDVNVGVQTSYGVYLGGPSNETYRYYFPGFRGATANDDASIEPGSSYFMGAMGKFSHGVSGSVGTSACFICKGDSLGIYKSAQGTVTAAVTASAVEYTMEVTGSAVGSTLETVLLASDATRRVLFVSGWGLATEAPLTLDDTSGDWTFVSEGTTYYMRRLGVNTSEPSHFTFLEGETGFASGSHVNTEGIAGIGLRLTYP